MSSLLKKLKSDPVRPPTSSGIPARWDVTHMAENGADIRVIQQLLGHSKLDSTQIYTEVSIRHLQEVHARTHPAGKGKT